MEKAFIIRNNRAIGMDVQKVYTSTPVGIIQPFASDTNIPRGYLLCDGASYKVAEYPDLYAVIGNTYGGDSTNFNVPDYRETVLVGVGENTTDTIADHDVYELGEFKDDQMESHTHGVTIPNMSTGSWSVNPSGSAGYSSGTKTQTSTATGTGTTTHGKQKGVTYIIKAFHTNEGVDSGVSDDVVDYVDNKVAEVKTTLPNIKKFANPGGTAKYITISGATLGDIEVHSAYAGKYMFTSTGAKPIFFGTSTYLGYTLTGWAWNSDKTKLYLRVNGHRDFVISAFGSDGIEISDMTTTAPTDVTFNTTFNYNAYIDNSTSENTSTYSSAKIDEKYDDKIFGYTSGDFALEIQLDDRKIDIEIIDNCGGKIELLGNGAIDNSVNYRFIKVLRLSYGNWTEFDATKPNDTYTKIKEVYVDTTNKKAYVHLKGNANYIVKGAKSVISKNYTDVDTSTMTLIPESKYASIDDSSTNTTSTWSSSKIASEINPAIDVSKVFLNGTLNIATLYTTYGAGRYVAVGQGTTGNGTVTIDIWTLVGGAISYIVNALYSPKTSVMFVGYTYENPTIDFDANYFTHCNHIAKVCTLA